MGDPLLKITSIIRLANGHLLLQGLGAPGGNHNNLSQTSRLNWATFSPLAPVTAGASRLWQNEDATVSSAPNRFYRLSFD
jgi:hypothetical protein